MKGLATTLVREAHRKLATIPLPQRVAVYFHDLLAPQHAPFAEAMRYFLERGYRPVGPEAFVAPDGCDRRLMVSFDDNYRCWHEALGLLERLGVTATFYVNTLPWRDRATPQETRAYFERLRYDGPPEALTRAELVAIARAGHRIGCHTRSHYDLGRLPRAQWEEEIVGCRRELEDLIGSAVTDFSFPFGMPRNFSPELGVYCRALGFRTIATATPGLQAIAAADPMALHRTRWHLDQPLARNVEDLCIDGRWFTGLTGRSTVG